MKTISIFGDSIAYGLSDNERGGWVERLKNYLVLSGKKYEVRNFSVSGDDTEELLKHFKKECEISKPDKLIFAIGINDSCYDYGDFKKNLGTLIEEAVKWTRDITFIGLTAVDESKVQPVSHRISYNNKTIEKFDEAIKDMAKKNHFKYINMQNVLENDDLPDGLHPNAEGHEKMFEVIKKEF